jgi:hypothetical protein
MCTRANFEVNRVIKVIKDGFLAFASKLKYLSVFLKCDVSGK